MIPKASTGGRATGTSFKGVFQYLNHDKREEGKTVSTSSDRVDWVATRNIVTDDPELASRIMAATARQQDDICLLYTSPSPRDKRQPRMPSSA